MSKYQDIMYNRYCKVESRLKDALSACKIYHCTAIQWGDAYNKIRESHDYTYLNQYYKGRLAGIESAIFNALFTDGSLEFRYIDVDGNYYLSHEIQDKYGSWSNWQDTIEVYLAKNYIPSDDRSNYFWKGTNKHI